MLNVLLEHTENEQQELKNQIYTVASETNQQQLSAYDAATHTSLQMNKISVFHIQEKC